MKSNIAVIVLNYFGCKDTIDYIASVSRALDAEVFLVDNSADTCEGELLIKSLSELPNVRIIRSITNLGFAKGVNLALRQAVELGHRRFLVLNNDSLLSQNAGTVFANAFKKYPNSMITATIHWGKDLRRGQYYHRYLGAISNRHRSENHGWQPYLSGCALAFDSALLEAVGFFNESFFMYGEDVELSYRAQKGRFLLKVLDEEIVWHKGSHSSKMAYLFYEYHVATPQSLQIPASKIAKECKTLCAKCALSY